MPLKYVYGQDEIVADFVIRMNPHEHVVGERIKNFKAIGACDENNELIAGIVYHSFNPIAGTMEIALAAIPRRRWMTPEGLGIAFRYPFVECKCQMVRTWTTPRYENILRIMAVMDFKFYTIPRMFGRDKDGIFCTLTYEDWAANKFCKRFEHHVVDARKEEAA